MARPRAFDETAALDAATDCFWRSGYAATSVRDLGAAMGLGAPSLYNAFGDKHALFTRCLDRYLDGNMRARIRRLESTLPPRAAIERFLEEVVARSLADPRGCLLVNTALEVAPHDAAIAELVADRLSELEGFFHRCLSVGQRDGTIAARRPARDVARLLLTTIMGLRVLARAHPEPALLKGAARQALSLLDPAAPD
ncbi:TetR family transcriptional regulator [Falsiroseomonas bella]|uniref:TetR family transcriptional regulator n=1 Tax=Falsiroseomonas bella TaxID=2184016 RepID=A0A317FD50_9PROT|nr:TetR/AcrR family transcriptional regulator [Falsiroseomonas bella]PWS36312.1 TetR family transcriptional regulator [Falsiroseomonas bella]